MSHLPERKEKICLNCKSVIYGRFCHICGQENTEPKESFWGLLTHFVYDITHFDGKFFQSTKYLLFRPGFLAAEYLRGRRASYLNPIRMYVFTSAFFFILFFSVIARDSAETDTERKQALIEELNDLKQELMAETDSARVKKLEKKINRTKTRIALVGQSGILKMSDTDSTDRDWILFDNMPRSEREYDSLQQRLPSSKRAGWFLGNVNREMVALNEKYRGRKQAFIEKFNEKFSHSIPQMMFVSLPLVALLLQLLYFRQRQYYYVNHVIFTINLYTAIYLLILVFYAVSWMYGLTGYRVFEILAFLSFLSIFFYLYKAMRNFYRQRRAKTVFKFLLFLFGFFLLMLFLMLVYLLISALQI